jgi:hypothetical protein
MEGKINPMGHLELKRSGGFLMQNCPFAREKKNCSHNCALFGSPEPVQEGDITTKLTLCVKELKFTAFADER